MKRPIFTVDSFTDSPFSGNPAAVCILEEEASEPWMRSVAAEMNLSETAFVQRTGDAWSLRWFTPTHEVDLCGHATLATAHVLWSEGYLQPDEAARFDTRSGRLTCTRDADGRIAMNFPCIPPAPSDLPDGALAALGIESAPGYEAPNGYLVVELPDQRAVESLAPDFAALLASTSEHLFVVTAPADDPDVDYVCRCFVPAWGINEDPVTGSIHCVLAPFWADKRGKSEFNVRQVSTRGGALSVQLEGDRVVVSGQAVTTLRGELAA